MIKTDTPTTKKLSRGKRISFLFMWIFVWPITMLGVGLVVAALFVGLMEANQSTHYEMYMGGFFASIVLVCTVGYILLVKSKNGIAKLGGKVLGAYTVCGMFAIIYIFSSIIGYTNNNQIDSGSGQVATAFVAPTLSRDASIDSTLRTIGAPDSEIAKFSTAYVDSFDDDIVEDQLGLYTSYINPTDGKFLYGEMKIKTGQQPAVERTMIAHEYLHHIWFGVMDEETKSRLESDLISTYGNDPTIRERTSSYTNAQNLKPTELFSYYCTESSDSYLSGYVLEQCNKYINRTTIQLIR